MKAIWFLFPLIVFAEESFMSDYEYGEILYNNPRGISCAACHGKFGEGKVIVKYQNEKGKHTIAGASIRNKTLKEMIVSINSTHKVMPRYYLTKSEIRIIYSFLQKINKK